MDYRSRQFVAVAGATLMGLATAAGCQKQDEMHAPKASGSREYQSASKAEPAARERSLEAPKDEDVRTAVERELLYDPSIPPGDVHVTVTEGIVELTGTVHSIMARSRAVRLAEMVKGVRSVSDQIAVDVSGYPSDQSLAEDVKTALSYDPATEDLDIDVTATGHTVRLRGMVDSFQESRLAELIASGVAGTKKVENQTTVNWAANRPDSEIQRDVQSRLRWDALVDDALIDVNVADRKVRLTGIVGSAAEKSRAELDGWVSGATEVDGSELTVARWARDPDLRGDKYTAEISDDDLERAIRDAALYDPRVNSFEIQVNVDAGIATLTGDVSSARAREVAAELARDTVGVVSVVNHIRVKTRSPIADARLQKRAVHALALDPVTSGDAIDVSVKDGTVTLDGKVHNYFESAEASDVVAGLAGTRAVINELSIEEPARAFVYDSYLAPYYPYLYTRTYLSPLITPKSDAQLYDDVEDALYWSPFVDQDDVSVVVDGGEVTLLGTVDSWAEYSAAAENAYEAGALGVDNRLQIR